MQYRFDFIQGDAVPLEYLEMDKQRRMENGIIHIGRAILRDYNYSSVVQADGMIQHGIELTVLNGQKYRRAILSIQKILCYHPSLQDAVEDIITELDKPDNFYD